MQPYLALRGTIDSLRDRWAPVSHTSTFRKTGQITPEEFLLAGDYLVYKFPSWSWSSASSPAKAVNYLPPNKQYLVTRGVPCHRRLDANFAGQEERVVRDEGFEGKGEDGEGWLSTGGDASGAARVGDVRSIGERGEVEAQEEEEEEEIPDMDDDDDEEAIIREPEDQKGKGPLRTYTLYITYTPYYRTPRLYLSGYHASTNTPLSPPQMLEDIVGDYKDKTVTLEDFPFFDAPLKTASVHPCRHAAVMKVLLDRADAALKLRRDKLRRAAAAGTKPVAPDSGLEGLVDEVRGLSVGDKSKPAGASTSSRDKEGGGDEWEVLHAEAEGDGEESEPAIRVDQYVVVFLKFMASVTPGIEHDFTMGV